MPLDVGDSIRRAAAEPTMPLDVTKVLRRGERLRRRKLALFATSSAGIVLAGFLFVQKIVDGPQPKNDPSRGAVVASGTPTSSGSASPSAPASFSAEDYPPIARDGDLLVFGPSLEDGQRFGWCPAEPLEIGAQDLKDAKKAAALGMAEIVKDAEGMSPDFEEVRPTGSALGSASPEFLADAVERCGTSVQDRTAVVALNFPKVTWSASLATATLYVSRLSDGWVIWDWPS